MSAGDTPRDGPGAAGAKGLHRPPPALTEAERLTVLARAVVDGVDKLHGELQAHTQVLCAIRDALARLEPPKAPRAGAVAPPPKPRPRCHIAPPPSGKLACEARERFAASRDELTGPHCFPEDPKESEETRP